MLPSWRSADSQVSLLLSRDVPCGETWQVLKKGGRSGFNVVVMGLSWWMMAQHGEGDVNVWSIVDDVTWVLQEMKKDIPSPLTPQKRPRDFEDEGEDQTKKRYDFCDI
jgi:hypothetical protein